MASIGVAGTLLLAVVVSGTLSRLSRLPLPLVQMALGAAIYGLGLAVGALDPALFFLLFLPPLLFIDGWRIPKDALRLDAGTILTLALGLVLATGARHGHVHPLADPGHAAGGGVSVGGGDRPDRPDSGQRRGHPPPDTGPADAPDTG